MKSECFFEELKSENTQFQYALSFGGIPSRLFMKAAGKDIAYHIHEHCQIVKNYCGRVAYIINGSTLVLETGEMLLINSKVPHTWIALEPTVCLNLGFYSQSLEFNIYDRRYIPYMDLLYGGSCPYIKISRLDLVYARVNQNVDNILEISRKKGLFYDACVHDQIADCSIALLERVLGETYYQQPAESNGLLEQILQYIDDNLMREIHMADVAKAIGFNTSYFSDYFKRKSGMTFKKYLNRRRLEMAAGYLKHTQLPVSEIVFLCGFGSMSAFYHNFTTRYGTSPICFRSRR